MMTHEISKSRLFVVGTIFLAVSLVVVATAQAQLPSLPSGWQRLYGQTFDGLSTGPLAGQDGWIGQGTSMEVIEGTGFFGTSNVARSTSGLQRVRHPLLTPGGDPITTGIVRITMDGIDGNQYSLRVGHDTELSGIDNHFFMPEFHGTNNSVLIQYRNNDNPDGQNDYEHVRILNTQSSPNWHRLQVEIDLDAQTVIGRWDPDQADVQAEVYDGTDGVAGPFSGSGLISNVINDGTFNDNGTPPVFTWPVGYQITEMIMTGINDGANEGIDNLAIDWSVPEPSSLTLLILGAVMLMPKRWRKR